MPVITEQDVRNAYQQYTGRQPTRAEINTHTGQTVPDIAAAAKNYFQPAAASSGGGGEPEGSIEMPSIELPAYPGISDEERKLLNSQNQLVQLQMQDLNRQNSLNAELFPLQKALYTQQLQFATELFPQQKAMIEQLIAESTPSETSKEITRLSEERALASLRGEPIPLSAAQQSQLDTMYNEAGRRGSADLRQFAEEMASGRGLRLSDTPIGDVALREASNLYSGLEASKAQAALDLGQSQQAFSESVRQFQSGLQQQAMQNRLSLAAGATNQPTTTSVNASSLIGSLQGTLGSLASNRQAQAQYSLAGAGLGLQAAQYNLQNRQFLESVNQSNLNRISQEYIAGLPRTNINSTTGGYQPNTTLGYIAAGAPIVSSGFNFGSALVG